MSESVYKDYWKITYTNVLTGLREVYMNVAYDYPEEAKAEIKLLIRDTKKWKKLGFNLSDMIDNDVSIPTSMCGSHWRVKKGKLRTDTPTYRAYLESVKKLNKLNQESKQTVKDINALLGSGESASD
jgi:hypothetical protein